MERRRSSTPLRLIAAFMMCGCGGEKLPAETLFENDELAYRLRGDASVCSEAPELTLSLARDLQELFDRDSRQLHYDLFSNHEDLSRFAPCSDGADGCFDPGEDRIYTTEMVSIHELTHAVLHEKRGGPRVLEEGIATLTERDIANVDGKTLGQMYGPLDLTLLLSTSGWEHLRDELGPIWAYDKAAAMARYFWDELGAGGFTELYFSLRERDDADTRRAKLEDAFDMSLEEIEAGFDDFARYPTGSKIWFSSMLERPLDPGTLTEPRDLCGLPQSFSFAHSSSERTVLKVSGEPLSAISIESDSVGIVHHSPSLVVGEEGHLTIFIDGPDTSLRVLLSGATTVTDVFLEYRDLSDPLDESPALILGMEPDIHEPVCLSSENSWSIEGGSRTLVDGEFVTARPTTIDCCLGEECTTHEAWENQLPRAFECPGGSCIAPARSFPNIFGPSSLPPAPASGRYFVIPVRHVEP